MIFPALNFITEEIKKSGLNAALGNISEIINDNNGGGNNASIIVSLINIEENRLSRDPQPYVRTETGLKKKNPAVHLYLTLLFTSISPGYTQALLDMQNLIGFFQRNYVFDHSNPDLTEPGIEKLIFEMVSLNLQQLHEIWTVLGGRYFPSVVYRMRMVTIDSITDEDGPLITEIKADYLKIG